MSISRFSAGVAFCSVLALSGGAIAQNGTPANFDDQDYTSKGVGNPPTIQEAASTLWDVKLDGGTYCVVAGKPINVQAPPEGIEVLPAHAEAAAPEIIRTSHWTVPADASMFDQYNLRNAGADLPGAKLIVVPAPKEDDLISIVNVLTAANCDSTLNRFAAAKAGKGTVEVLPGG